MRRPVLLNSLPEWKRVDRVLLGNREVGSKLARGLCQPRGTVQKGKHSLVCTVQLRIDLRCPVERGRRNLTFPPCIEPETFWKLLSLLSFFASSLHHPFHLVPDPVSPARNCSISNEAEVSHLIKSVSFILFSSKTF